MSTLFSHAQKPSSEGPFSKTKHQNKYQSKYPYIGCPQDIRDYTLHFFYRVLPRLPASSPLPTSPPSIPQAETCIRCKSTYGNEYNPWCNACETPMIQQNFQNWSSENEHLDKFIRDTQLNCFKPLNSTGELEGPQPPLRLIPYSEYSDVSLTGQGGFSKVYHAMWGQNILHGTLKWWVGEMEKQNSNEIYRIIYEEASDDVRQHGIVVGKNLNEGSSGKRFMNKVFGHMRVNSKSDKSGGFADWRDRVITRVGNEVAQKRLIIPDKQYTGTTPQHVALKQLINSKSISGFDFVRELQIYYRCMNSGRIPQLYGISRDSETKDYVLVTQYAPGGDLRRHISENFKSMNWRRKVALVFDIAKSLKAIHSYGFVHHNFHSGNVLIDVDPNDATTTPQERQERSSKMSSTFRHEVLISDLGISIPAAEFSEPYQKKRYGILPYMAPEVLQGGECSRPSDVYSFAIVMWELTSGELPYRSIPHDRELAKAICDGKRPEITRDTPKFYANLMERCWDSSAPKRPGIDEIVKTIGNWRRPHVTDQKLFDDAEEVRKLMLEEKEGIEKGNVHEEAVYHSRPLSFGKI